ncbi:MAG: metallophosphoesterase family protein [candidate division KSB1 bacterium]|nr:metallophosphoesterase family protein [candidate division KSB1 bacterium]MDZ7336709.1 metallophosphoesterase family protein [candidate division KSB1 bacterium]MDZ7358532.1 metallophosphoesterase family protein [candidate division KSB1 bacterium]MDZ7402214.1 metallophosphoesterase family protein [candidate division KSB1 bacterium]
MNQALSLSKKIGFWIVGIGFLWLLAGAQIHGQAHGPAMPERIILNLTDRPATSQAITWRTQAPIATPQVQFVLARSTPDLEGGARVFKARTDTLHHSGQMMYYHSVKLDSLQPNSLYAYRVGDGTVWSEWNQFRTAMGNEGPFQFVYIGDPQNDILSICSRVFRAAYQKSSEARFWLLPGDLVNDGGNDDEWHQFFDALGWISRTTQLLMLPGNHEYVKIKRDGETTRSLTPLWRPQFSLPSNGPVGLEETVYYCDCQGARIIALNGNEGLELQAAWLDDVLKNNPNRWTIVAIHQPLYSAAKGRDNKNLQELFLPLFDRYGVDLVLQGHDHCYSRSYKLRAGKIVDDQSPGTVYVVSVSGPKIYELNLLYRSLMAKMDAGKQWYQIISIHHDQLSFEAWTADGELFDSFELRK